MTATDIQNLDEYDLWCHGLLADPYPFYDRMRAEDPVHWSEPLQSWVLTRYKDIHAAFLDSNRLASGRVDAFFQLIAEPLRSQLGPLYEYMCRWLVMTDPPDHVRLRKLMNKAFSPRMIETRRPRIEQNVNELIDKVEGRGRMDLIQDFAYPLPAVVIYQMLGLPADNQAQFQTWSQEIAAFAGAGGLAAEGFAQQAQKSLLDFVEFCKQVIEQRRREPQDDLISTMIAAHEQGQTLSDLEMLAMCVMLFVAGHETTTGLIGNGTLALLKHPGELRRFKEDPLLLTPAIEELLRYDSSLQRQTRLPREDIVISERKIATGQPILLMQGAANRDPEQFEDSNTLNISRQPNPHVAFGVGIHFCLGAPLARLEAKIAIPTLLNRLGNLQLDPNSQVKWRQNISLRAMDSMPVIF